MLTRKKVLHPLISTDELVAMIKTEDLTEINIALRRKRAALDGRDQKGRTCMHWACELGLESVVSFLIDAVAESQLFYSKEMEKYHKIESMGTRALKNAIDKAHLSTKDLPDPGLKISARSAWTERLRRRGIHARVRAYLDMKDDKGHTPLHFACRLGHHGVVKTLVERGSANLEARDQCQWTALHWACKVGPPHRTEGHNACAIYLANIAVNTGLGFPVQAKPSRADKDGLTPLHWACRHGESDVVWALVKRARFKKESPRELDAAAGSVILDARDINGWQATHWGAIGGNPECLRALFSVKIDDRAREKQASKKAKGGGAGGRKAFLDVEARTNDGLTAALIAANYGKTECNRVLHTMGAVDPEEIAAGLKLWLAKNKKKKKKNK
jgi:ankyrin repeat protein